MTDRELFEQALEALDSDNPDIQLRTAIALRERLAQPEQEHVIDCPRCGHCCSQQPVQERPQNCGTGYCSCVECLFEPEQPVQEPVIEKLGYVPPSDTSPERVAKAPKQRHEQEPMVKHMMEWVEYLKRQSDHGQHLHIPSGMSAGTCWELAIELEQFISTAPPRREWQGLDFFDKTLLRTTYAPMKPVYYDRVNDHSVCAEVVTDWDNLFAAIEAKLKEKNT